MGETQGGGANLGSTAPFDRAIGRRRGDRIVGASRATQEVLDQALLASRSDLPVLVTGPAGSGKEHVARAIHAWSRRASAAFESVSCSGNDALLGREIFGCAASAYDTLPERYEGALATAAGGTLLIDAVDRLPEMLRDALAKAIAEGRYEPEGDGPSVPLRARIIATSLDDVDASPFADLPQHRIRLLPLADRPEDVLPLAAHCLSLCAQEAGLQPVGFTADAREALLREEWPGNVRELSERVRQAVKLAGHGAVTSEALVLAADAGEVPSFKEAKRAFETRYVQGLLRRCDGNISRAARLAKKDRKDFYDVIRRTGVDPSEFR